MFLRNLILIKTSETSWLRAEIDSSRTGVLAGSRYGGSTPRSLLKSRRGAACHSVSCRANWHQALPSNFSSLLTLLFSCKTFYGQYLYSAFTMGFHLVIFSWSHLYTSVNLPELQCCNLLLIVQHSSRVNRIKRCARSHQIIITLLSLPPSGQRLILRLWLSEYRCDFWKKAEWVNRGELKREKCTPLFYFVDSPRMSHVLAREQMIYFEVYSVICSWPVNYVTHKWLLLKALIVILLFLLSLL